MGSVDFWGDPRPARLGGTLAAGIHLVRLEGAGTVVSRQAVVARQPGIVGPLPPVRPSARRAGERTVCAGVGHGADVVARYGLGADMLRAG